MSIFDTCGYYVPWMQLESLKKYVVVLKCSQMFVKMYWKGLILPLLFKFTKLDIVMICDNDDVYISLIMPHWETERIRG